MEYSDGRRYIKPDKIIKPVVMKIPDRFMNDFIFFLQVRITLHKHKYNFSIARLVYHCFVKPIKIDDDSLLILTKDGNGLNIKPSILKKASHSEKQKRIFDLERREPLVIKDEARQRAIINSRLSNSKEITQYNMQGEQVGTYQSVAVAAEKTGISHSHISNRARGIEYSAGGFIWRHGKADSINIKPMLKKIEQRRKRNKEIYGKKVSQYTMVGKRVATFPTINDAAKATGLTNSEISAVMQNRRKSAGGFYWQRGHGPEMIDLSGYEYGQVLRARRKQRPIRQYSKDGKRMQRFESIKIAAEILGVDSSTVIGALKGKHKTAGDYMWKYI